jgi:hypothetical protein
VTGASGGPELRLALERLAMQRGTDLRDLPVAFLTAPGNETPALLRWYARNAVLRPPAYGDPNLVWLGYGQRCGADGYALTPTLSTAERRRVQRAKLPHGATSGRRTAFAAGRCGAGCSSAISTPYRRAARSAVGAGGAVNGRITGDQVIR